MKRALTAYAACMMVYLIGDAIWLGTTADPFYRARLGPLVADCIVWPPAIAFYFLFLVGLVRLVVLPTANASIGINWATGWKRLLGRAALFGLCTYGTFDLVNWATIQDWPWVVSLVDMAWGTSASMLSAAAGYAWLTKADRKRGEA